MKVLSGTALTAALVIGIGMAGACPAQAADPGRQIASITPEPSGDGPSSFTEEDWAQAYREFASTEVSRFDSVVRGVTTTTFQVTPELGITLVDPATLGEMRGDGARDERLGVGKTKYGYWFSFNQFDQNALSNIFVGAAIVAAICAIPGVGQVACALASVVVSVAITYVHKSGICSNKRTLYWYDVKGGSTMACRSSAPQ